MKLQVQIGDTSRAFFESARECWGFRKLHFAWDSEDTFYGFWFTLQKRWEYVLLNGRSHGRHSPRLAWLLALFTFARIACLFHFCFKPSRFDYSISLGPRSNNNVLRSLILIKRVFLKSLYRSQWNNMCMQFIFNQIYRLQWSRILRSSGVLGIVNLPVSIFKWWFSILNLEATRLCSVFRIKLMNSG